MSAVASDAAGQPSTRLLRIFLLGGFRVLRNGVAIGHDAWSRRDAERLVKLLAVHTGHQLHREEIIEALWPDLRYESGPNAVSRATHAARRALEPELDRGPRSSYLQLTGETVALNPEAVWVDVDEFEELATRALRHGDATELEAALAVYGGDLLPEDRYEEWTIAPRDRVAGSYVELLVRLAAVFERRGAYGPAVQHLGRALEREPAREDALRQLMRLYLRTGHRRAALQQYTNLQSTLGEYGAGPARETQALYREILALGTGTGGTIPPGAESTEAGVAPLLLPPIGSGLHVPFIDRGSILNALLRDVASAQAGRGSTILLGGDIGVGKTRLAEELCRQAYERGCLVLWATCYDRESVLPYAAIASALDGYAASQAPDERNVFARTYPDVARVLPSLASFPPAQPTITSYTDRQPLFESIARLLGDLATGQGLVLAVNDIHVADPDSLQLLLHLARLATERCWLIIATFREGDLPLRSDFDGLVNGLDRGGLARRMTLGPLDSPDCDLLVQALVSARSGETVAGRDGRLERSDRRGALDVETAFDEGLLEYVRRATRGNPLFVTQTVETLRERGALELIDGCWRIKPEADLGVPRQTASLVHGRIRDMGSTAERVLSIGAVIGHEIPYTLLCSVTQTLDPPVLEPHLLDALDRAAERRLLDERPSGYVFHHPLYRSVLYEALSRARRVYLHRLVADIVEAQDPCDAETLVYHRVASNDENAARYIEQAGDRARTIYANELACDHYRDAMHRLEERGQVVHAARVRRRLGAVLTTMARYDEALEVLVRAHETYRLAANVDGQFLAVAQLAHADFMRGASSQGIERTEGTLALGGASPYARAALHGVLAELYWSAGRYDDQLIAAERAIDAGHAAGDSAEVQRVVIGCTMWRGVALVALERVDQGIEVLEGVVPPAERSGDLLTASRALNTIAVAYQVRGEFRRQAPYLERALDAAERLGDQARIAFLRYRRGWLASILGDWPDARRHLEQAVTIARDLGASSVLPRALYGLGAQLLVEGEWEEATRYLEESVAVAARTGDVQVAWAGQSALAERDIREGRGESARQRIEPYIDARGLASGDVAFLLALQARSYAEVSEEPAGLERAEALVKRAMASIQVKGNMPETVEVLRAQGIVAGRLGRWAEAQSAFDEALRLTGAIENPYAQALVHHDRGVTLVWKSDLNVARQSFETALAIFQRLGAGKDIERTGSLLAGLTQPEMRGVDVT